MGLSLFYIGVSVVVIGVGQLLRTILGRSATAGRVVGTLEGLGLLVFWSLPLDTYDALVGELKAGPEIFVLSGVAMVGAAVWLIMNNTPVIVAIVYGVLGRIKSLRAVMRTAVAYPMGARFLTGLTVAMFAMIIFNLMIFAILNNLGNLAREEPTRVTGGYDITAIVNPEIPIDDFKGTLAAESEGSRTDIQVYAAQEVNKRVHDAGASVVVPVEARQVGGADLEFKALQLMAVDNTFLEANEWRVSHYDPSRLLNSGNINRDMWLALRGDPSLGILNHTALPKDDSFSPNGPVRSQLRRVHRGGYHGKRAQEDQALRDRNSSRRRWRADETNGDRGLGIARRPTGNRTAHQRRRSDAGPDLRRCSPTRQCCRRFPTYPFPSRRITCEGAEEEKRT